MKARYAVGISLVCGMALGAAGLDTLRAQSKAPAYIVTEVEILDQAAFKEFSERSTATVAPFGKRLVRGGAITSIEGTPPKRVVITQFESAEKAKAWRASDAWKALEPIRKKAVKNREYIVEGLAN